MATDGKARLRELLGYLSEHRLALSRARISMYGEMVVNCEAAILLDYATIRAHCEKHALPLPMDVPEKPWK